MVLAAKRRSGLSFRSRGRCLCRLLRPHSPLSSSCPITRNPLTPLLGQIRFHRLQLRELPLGPCTLRRRRYASLVHGEWRLRWLPHRPYTKRLPPSTVYAAKSPLL